MTIAPSSAWNGNYQKLVQFHKVHKHHRVPRDHEHRMLAKWTARLRNRGVSGVSLAELDLLAKIDFDWETQTDREDSAWNEKWSQLATYHAKNGHSKVPQVHADDPELGTWVANQRKRHNQNKLRADRKTKLEELDFLWGSSGNKRGVQANNKKYDDQWSIMYAKLQAYKSNHGNCKVPYYYPQDPSLALWVSTQRRECNQKTWYGSQREIRQDRKEQLDRLEFDWKIVAPKPQGPK